MYHSLKRCAVNGVSNCIMLRGIGNSDRKDDFFRTK